MVVAVHKHDFVRFENRDRRDLAPSLELRDRHGDKISLDKFAASRPPAFDGRNKVGLVDISERLVGDKTGIAVGERQIISEDLDLFGEADPAQEAAGLAAVDVVKGFVVHILVDDRSAFAGKSLAVPVERVDPCRVVVDLIDVDRLAVQVCKRENRRRAENKRQSQ